MVSLETKYLGLTLENPLVVSSSGLTQAVDKIKSFAQAGAGAVVLKSLFEEQILMEGRDMLHNENATYPEAENYIMNYTRQNSVQEYCQLIRDVKSEVSIPIIASINCISNREWTSFAKQLEMAGADAVELNLYVLPCDTAHTSEKLEERYLRILSDVKKEVSVPVSVKIGFHFTNLVRFVDQLKAHGADAVTMFNRFYEPDIDLDNLEITSSEIFSAPSDLRRSLRWMGIISSQVPNLDLAASTGIHDGEAMVKQLLAGATVGQVCSTLYINGPERIGEILGFVNTFMKKWNFKKIDDFRGRLNYSTIQDPAMYERAQFMKYFASKISIW